MVVGAPEPTAADKILATKTISERTDFSTTLTTNTTGTIYSAEDDDGTSYYYAGAPTDNWVKFAGLYWRIIRFNGDGTVRLIYNGTSTSTTGTDTQLSDSSAFNTAYTDNMYVGYMYTSGEVHGLGTNSTLKGVLDGWYTTKLSDFTSYIDTNAGFCGDRSAYTNNAGTTSGGGTGTTTTYYGAYIRLFTNKTPTFKCTDSSDLYTTSSSKKGNKALTYPIGLISADEAAYGGGTYGTDNSNFYLFTGQSYWTLSPYWFGGMGMADIIAINSYGNFGNGTTSATNGVRPVINLRADVTLTGSGTSTDPYVVS